MSNDNIEMSQKLNNGLIYAKQLIDQKEYTQAWQHLDEVMYAYDDIESDDKYIDFLETISLALLEDEMLIQAEVIFGWLKDKVGTEGLSETAQYISQKLSDEFANIQTPYNLIDNEPTPP